MGSGSGLLAQITGPAKLTNRQGREAAPPQIASGSKVFLVSLSSGIARSRDGRGYPCPTDRDHESNQANRAISTSQLNASPRLHIWPINVVVFHGSDREHSFRGGFPA